jgi:hypothetical protein
MTSVITKISSLVFWIAVTFVAGFVLGIFFRITYGLPGSRRLSLAKKPVQGELPQPTVAGVAATTREEIKV